VPEYEETLRSCLDEVQRVQSLTEELLALARIDAREEAETAQPIAISEIVDAAVSTVTPEAARRHVRICAERPLEVLVNAAPIASKVALANILDNAVKFSAAGGEVKVTVVAGGDQADIVVSDSGPGVSPEDVPRLFQRFYRGKASRATDVPGVGLGLAISQALVERQGGRISVEASGEKGATFTVHLPRA
jgi:two-component system OmpR family sensor kinase